MMRHLPEELISQWLDRELDSRESAMVQEHLNLCESCRALKEEMWEASRIFRTADAPEPPSYLWTRIAARLDEEKRERQLIPSWLRWLPISKRMTPQPAWLRATVWAPAAILLIAIGSTIAFMEYQSVTRAHIAAIAEIDRAHVALLTLNNKTYNPFHESTATDSGINPFTQSNLKDQPNPFRTVLGRQ
jgi:predicted anti-sigma-YlaC factor YlaD